MHLIGISMVPGIALGGKRGSSFIRALKGWHVSHSEGNNRKLTAGAPGEPVKITIVSKSVYI